MRRTQNIWRTADGFITLARNQQARGIVKRFAHNYFGKLPFLGLLIATSACQADCDWCQFQRSSRRPLYGNLDSYVDVLEPMNLPFLSIVGGEPLMREDLEKIISESKEKNGIPFVHVVTNAALLTVERYHRLERSGLDELVISLDFASPEHSARRGIPGLYEHIRELLPELNGKLRVRFNAILMRDNLLHQSNEGTENDVKRIIELARTFGYQVSFGAYSFQRNNNMSHMPDGSDRERLALTQAYLVSLASAHDTVISTPSYLRNAFDFLGGKRMPGCQAGKRYIWISPEGRYMPCPDFPEYSYVSLYEAQQSPLGAVCLNCYSECRGVPEALTTRNPVRLLRRAIELGQIVVYLQKNP